MKNMKSNEKKNVVKLPVSLGWSREEIRELNPGLSESQIDTILSAAYELQVSFDLGLGKFVSVKTVTHYSTPVGEL